MRSSRVPSAPSLKPREGASYAPKLDKREFRIDWRENRRCVERRVRAFHPSPGAVPRDCAERS